MKHSIESHIVGHTVMLRAACWFLTSALLVIRSYSSTYTYSVYTIHQPESVPKKIPLIYLFCTLWVIIGSFTSHISIHTYKVYSTWDGYLLNLSEWYINSELRCLQWTQRTSEKENEKLRQRTKQIIIFHRRRTAKNPNQAQWKWTRTRARARHTQWIHFTNEWSVSREPIESVTPEAPLTFITRAPIKTALPELLNCTYLWKYRLNHDPGAKHSSTTAHLLSVESMW